MADGTIYIDTAIDSSTLEKEMKDTEHAIKRTEAQLDKLIEKQIRFVETGGNVDSRAFKVMEYDIAQTRSQLEGLNTKFADLQASQIQAVNGTASLGDATNLIKNSFRNLRPNIVAIAKSLPRMAGGGVVKGFKRLGAILKNVGKNILGIGKGVKTTRMSMLRMLSTSLLIGMAFRTLMAIINGMKQGMNNLAQYSSETNKDLSVLKSSLTQLKNSFATAFAPILTVVTPILNSFINTISKAVTYIGMLIAALSGKNKFTKAVAVQEDYAAGLEGTASAAKNAEKAQNGYLSGLDEISRYDDSKTSSTGGVGNNGNASVSEMFEDVEVPNTFKSLAKKIKKVFKPIIDVIKKNSARIKKATSEWFADLDLGPLAASTEEAMEKLAPLVDLLLGGLAWAYENILLPFGKWTIEKGLPLLIEDLGKAFEFVVEVIQILNPVFQFLWKRILKPFGETVSEVVENILIAFGGLLDFLIGVFTGDWNRAFEGFITVVSGFYGVVSSIFNLLKNTVFVPFDNFLTRVFTKDWTYAFGIVGDILNGFFTGVNGIWSGIKQILGGIINFIAGVFTGDWRRAWNGVKDIFKGVFNTLISIAKTPINTIIGILNGLITGVVSGINAVIRGINRINFKVPDWIPIYGGKKVGFNLKQMTAPKVPYLATGAVIPPNAPFMAVLGDQKHGTNIEAPLETIKQAVAEVLGSRQTSGGTYTFVGQINRRTLFEEIVDEAKVIQMTTGRNPFELA